MTPSQIAKVWGYVIRDLEVELLTADQQRAIEIASELLQIKQIQLAC